MNITVYSTTTCGICHALMQWLEKQNISYTKVVVDTDPAGMAKLMEVSGGAIGVPFTTIEKDAAVDKIQGFDQNALKKSLDL